MVALTLLKEPFTGSTINTALWNNITGGAAALDPVADILSLTQPTVSGTTNTFGTTSTWDATGSSIYALIGAVPTGNGNTTTIFKLLVDANNSIAIRLRAGVFELARQTAGTTVVTTLPAYDPHTHRWWRLREQSGTWYAEASADPWNWRVLGSTAYSWSATALQFQFQTSAGATELAGQVATIQNINSMLGTPFNAAWPQMEHGFGARWNVNGCTFPLDRFSDMSQRTRGAVSVSRGKQYEIDQVQAGEMALPLANPDGLFDPLNTAGPFYGHVQPYQPYRIRAQWPRTRNLLSQVQASGGDVGGYALGTIPQGSGGVSTFSATDTSGGSIVSTATAWQGGRALQFAVPSGTPAATGTSTTGLIVYTPQPAVELGGTYTLQFRVRNVTAATSLTVAPFVYSVTAGVVGTANVGSSVVLTGSATAAWTTVTLTATVGQDAGYAVVGLRVAATAAATCNIQVDGWQFERGSTATPWACPGIWYPVFGGFVERYPPDWGDDGTYGKVSLTAVDAFALLSQDDLKDPLTEELNDRGPRFLFKLDDPAGSTSAADWTGNYPAPQLGVSKYGAGSFVFGTSITATDPVNGVFTGAEGPVATLSNASPGTNLIGGATFLKLTSSGIKGPADPTLWSRVIAFRYTGPLPTSQAILWSSMDGQRAAGNPSGSRIHLSIFSDGKPFVQIAGPNGTSSAVNAAGATNCADGNWHFVAFGYSEALGQVFGSQDGAYGVISGYTSALTPTGLIADNLGAFVDVTVGNGTTYAFKGDIAFAAEFPSFLTSAQVVNMYTAWKSACNGESTDARYARILRYAGYTGASSIQAGLTTSMGPAKIEGQDPVSALNAVVETEAGNHFVAADGRPTFRSRSARYNATTPVIVFGERTDLGECPYEDVRPDFDATRIGNRAEVTQESTGQVFYAQDATSIGNYFSRPLTRTVNSTSSLEVQDSANYFVSRYRNPAVRMNALKVHVSALPAWWPQLLALELGTRARVMRRPNGAPAIQAEVFVEKIDWEFDEENEAWLTLQCSPADITPYGVFAAWHTTLATSVLSGVTSISVNASADNVNPLAAQLMVGQQLTLDPGGANAETVTVAAVGATSSGWTTATLTLTVATTKAHTAGITVCEVLPAGVTDPTTWDANRFDQVAFAY